MNCRARAYLWPRIRWTCEAELRIWVCPCLGIDDDNGVFGIGYALPSIGQYVPLASVVTGGPSVIPILSSTLALCLLGG